MVSMQDKASLIVIGKIVGVYGIKGWLKILSFTRPKENILEYVPWLIKQNEAWQAMSVVEGRPQGKGLIASFAGITDRDEAMALVDSEIAIQRDQLPAAKEGEFFWVDLINLQVINEQNEILGVVTELLETGANDVLVVEAEKQRYLIPYVQDVYIKDVDIEQGIIQVDWQSDD
jgi:16S rRNA processing protein RimM